MKKQNFLFYICICFSQILQAQLIPKIESPTEKYQQQRFLAILSNIEPKADFAEYLFLVNYKGVQFYQEKINKLQNQDQKILLESKLAEQYLLNGQTEKCIEILERILPESEIFKDNIQRRGEYTFIKSTLAISYFRLGEQKNCILNHNAESCIFPIQNAGVYKFKDATKHAIDIYKEIIDENTDNSLSKWLLNLAYMSIGEWPDSVPAKYLIPLDKFDEKIDNIKFKDIAPSLGINQTGLSGSESLDDFDNDGDLDLFIVQEGFDTPAKLLINNGDKGFEDKSQQAGITGEIAGRITVHADFNNDGFIDVFICRGGWQTQENNFPPSSLMRNNGDGTFTNVTIESGLLTFLPISSAAWGDYDNDGWLDLFMGVESIMHEYPQEQNPHPSLLYHNNKDGTFTEVTKESGINVVEMIKGVSWGDYNNDGLLDLYLSNYKGRRYLFKNSKKSTGESFFTDETLTAGVGNPLSGIPTFFFDYNNDGWLDIFTPAHYNYDQKEYVGFQAKAETFPSLYRNKQDGTFEDVTKLMGLNRNLFVMGINYGDIDYDGYPDIYAGTGNTNYQDLYPNLMLRNDSGNRFQDVTAATRTGHLQKGHGVAFGDIDNDGDQDMYAVLGGAFSGDVYQNAMFNNSGNGNHWIYLNLQGKKSNRSAIGARIKVTIDTEKGEQEIFTNVNTGGSFGASCLRREIGLGNAKSIKQIEVFWPTSNKNQVFTGLQMNALYQIIEGNTSAKLQELKKINFENIMNKKVENHHD